MKIKRLIFIYLFFFSLILFSKEICTTKINQISEKHWQCSFNFGLQMSGIKDEDFILSNYSPKISSTIGYWFSDIQALRIGYKGPYFHTISDKKKHQYSYFFGEVVFRMDKLFTIYRNIRLSHCIHVGSGYLYNNDYRRPNICANIGISLNWWVSSRFSITSEVSAIMGWDIYQGDEDILPSITFGISHSLGVKQ